ncbi:hypothetical protein B0H19DRAFT_1258610 [Mycena capillaripes]|nr:hypothetical protein B0H19DRAFT_1258610 [Mycena capillaripes]
MASPSPPSHSSNPTAQARMVEFLQGLGIDLGTFQAMVASTSEPLPPLTDSPSFTAAMVFSPNAGATARRPHIQRIKMLQKNVDGLDDLCPPNTVDNTTCFVRSNVLKGKAERQLAAKEYLEARAGYIEAASEMIATALPSSGDVHWDVYDALGHGWETNDLMACINGIIECSKQMKDYDTALRWLEEADVLDKKP